MNQAAHVCNCELNLTFSRQVLLLVTIETVEHIVSLSLSCASLKCSHPVYIWGCDPQSFSPQAQWVGMLFIFHPYLMQTASVNSCLFSAYPIALIGKADSQEDAPFSIAPFMSCCDSGVNSTTQQKFFMSRLGCFLDNFWPLNPNLASCFACCQYFSRYLQYYIYIFSKYLISQIFLLTYITTFEPETPAGHPKYQKTRIVA